MAKRQTDTKIWSTQRWFKKLHPYHKLAWKYLTDVCDHAGIWKVDFAQLVDDTGIEDFDLKGFVHACNQDFDKENGQKISRERIKLVNKTTVWLTGFVRFQYENKEFKINPSVPAIKSALTILNGYGILQEALDKGYITLSKPFERTIDKDKDTDTGELGSEEEEIGGVGEKEGGRDGPVLGVVIYDLPEYLRTKQPIKLEAMMMESGKRGLSPPQFNDVLQKFHLHQKEHSLYPKHPDALIAGFQKWIINEKPRSNGAYQQSPANNSRTAGRDEVAERLEAKIRARGSQTS